MPSKYVAKNPRPPVDIEERARLAVKNASDRREALRRCHMANMHMLLKRVTHREAIEALCSYFALDELEMVITDIQAKRRKAVALAAKNRSRQAS
jgi:hypothetical protein